MDILSDVVEGSIRDAIDRYDDSVDLGTSCFEELVSMGELIDRLSIVNFKLYTLKDKVMQTEDHTFRSWASEEDVKLVKERARLKACIDSKIIEMFKRWATGDETAGFNAEIKRYG